MIDFKSLFARKKDPAAAVAPAAPAKENKFSKSLQGLTQFDLKSLFSGKNNSSVLMSVPAP